MSGHERALFKICVAHALCNVLLSIILVFGWQATGVAMATLISSVVFGWLILLPKILRTIHVGLVEYVGFHFRGVLPGFIVFALTLAPLAYFFPLAAGSSIVIGLGWRGLVVMAPTLILNYRVMRTTWREA